jgi:hypothetical protein
VKWLVIAAFVFAAGCKKKQAPPAPDNGSAVATGSAMGSGSAAPAVATGSAGSAAVDVPTEQDFEDKAATDITDKNVDAKLKSLEADLSQ